MKRAMIVGAGCLFGIPTALILLGHWVAWLTGTQIEGFGAGFLATISWLFGAVGAVAIAAAMAEAGE
jgi:hypothetical protein